MDQQTKFKTALAALAASAETKDRKLTKADVKEFLEDMDLGEEQKMMMRSGSFAGILRKCVFG